MITRIGQIAMTVADLPRAVAFYRDVLGLRFLFEAPPAMAFFECGGTRLMLALPEREGAPPASSLARSSTTRSTISRPRRARSPGAAPPSSSRRTSSRGCRTPMCGWRSCAIPTATCSRS